MSRLRWAKFFWADWAGDNALSLCSLAAQGLWMRLLCLAAQNEPYGSVLVAGRIPTDQELAKLVRPAIRVERLRKLLAELERHQVVRRDPDGTLFSRRMRADFAQSAQQSDKGKKSAQSRRAKGMERPRFEPKVVAGSDLDSESRGRLPPKSPRRSRTRKKGGGWAEVATDLAAKGTAE